MSGFDAYITFVHQAAGFNFQANKRTSMHKIIYNHIFSRKVTLMIYKCNLCSAATGFGPKNKTRLKSLEEILPILLAQNVKSHSDLFFS